MAGGDVGATWWGWERLRWVQLGCDFGWGGGWVACWVGFVVRLGGAAYDFLALQGRSVLDQSTDD
jgi:hypothetical protein